MESSLGSPPSKGKGARGASFPSGDHGHTLEKHRLLSKDLTLGLGGTVLENHPRLCQLQGSDEVASRAALARLGLGRAYALEAGVKAGLVPVPPGREHPQGALLQQDALAKARAAYQDFLTLWKDADPDIPVLKQAKAEYAKRQ